MSLESINQQQKERSDEELESRVAEKEEGSPNMSFDDETILMNKAMKFAANNVVKNHVITSLVLGLVPVPLLDISTLTATQLSMLRSLSELYDVPFEDSNSKSLITSLLGGSLPVLGVIGLSSVAKFIPGIGTLAGSASLSVTAGAVTYAVGQVFVMHFEEGGTLDDFKPKQAQLFFKREFEAGKGFVRDIKNEIKAEKMKRKVD